MCHWPGSSLVHLLACRRKGDHEPVMTNCQLYPWEHSSVNALSESINFHWQIGIWKYRLLKWRPSCPGVNTLTTQNEWAKLFHGQNLKYLRHINIDKWGKTEMYHYLFFDSLTCNGLLFIWLTDALLAMASRSSVMETIEARWPNSELQDASASCQFFGSLKILHTCWVPQSNQELSPLLKSAEIRINNFMLIISKKNIA